MIRDKKKFSEDLKEFFKTKGLTQQMIAKQLGITQSYVGMLMSGNKEFGKKAARTWADTFGLSEAWLLTGEGPMIGGEVQQTNQNGDNINGAGITVQKTDSEFFDLLKKKDEQIDRLLAIIEKMQS